MTILGNRILVQPLNAEETTKGGIILPKENRKYPIGKIVQLGLKVKKLKVGDTVMYYKGVGAHINYRGDDLLLLSEDGEIISTI